MVNIVSSRL